MIVTISGRYKCTQARVNTDTEIAERNPYFSDVYPDIHDTMYLGVIESMLCDAMGKRTSLPSSRIVISKAEFDGDTLTIRGSAEGSPMYWELIYKRS